MPAALTTTGTRRRPRLTVRPVTPERWKDLADLFGAKGACMGCWCMFYRLPFKEWSRRRGASNRRALYRIVKSGRIPGLLGYLGGEPVAWCCLGPREEFPVLDRHRAWARIDDRPVWSVVCFFTRRGSRRRGLTLELLRAAVDYARRKGARILEGYPTEPDQPRADMFVWTGVASAFRRAGFRCVDRRGRTRVMRRHLRPGR
jgi:GNAT superfamily N-acetyltransferase